MYFFVISEYHTFTSKNFGVSGLLGEKSEFFIPWEIQIELDFHQVSLIQNFKMILERQKSGA